jgi:hypothetical protein
MKLPEKTEKAEHAELNMTINKKRVIRGDTIKGEVNLAVKESLQNCTLRIDFIAEECCEIKKGGSTVVDKRELFPPEEVLLINNIACEAGSSYKHEYKFTLPDKAPASFEEDNKDSNGCIFYIVLVTFKAGDKNDLVTWRKLVVRETFPKEELANQKDEGDISGYCCSNKGHLKVSCMVESLATITRVDSHVSGKVEVDNTGCNYKISSLNAKLAQRVYMQAKDRKHVQDDVIVQWDLGQVEASQNSSISFRVKVPYNKKFKSLASSTTGKIMRREYFIEILPQYDTSTYRVPKINITLAIENLKTYKEKEQPKA